MITDRHYGYWIKRLVNLISDSPDFIGYQCSECGYITVIKGEKFCSYCKATMSERIKDESKQGGRP